MTRQSRRRTPRPRPAGFTPVDLGLRRVGRVGGPSRWAGARADSELVRWSLLPAELLPLLGFSLLPPFLGFGFLLVLSQLANLVGLMRCAPRTTDLGGPCTERVPGGSPPTRRSCHAVPIHWAVPTALVFASVCPKDLHGGRRTRGAEGARGYTAAERLIGGIRPCRPRPQRNLEMITADPPVVGGCAGSARCGPGLEVRQVVAMRYSPALLRIMWCPQPVQAAVRGRPSWAAGRRPRQVPARRSPMARRRRAWSVRALVLLRTVRCPTCFSRASPTHRPRGGAASTVFRTRASWSRRSRISVERIVPCSPGAGARTTVPAYTRRDRPSGSSHVRVHQPTHHATPGMLPLIRGVSFAIRLSRPWERPSCRVSHVSPPGPPRAVSPGASA